MIIKTLSLLVVFLAITKACDFDALLDAFYDDFTSSEEGGTTQKPPNPTGSTAAQPPGQTTVPTTSATAAKPPRPQVTSVDSNSPGATSAREGRSHHYRRKRHHDQTRYAPNYQEPVVENKSVRKDHHNALKNKILDLLETMGESDEVMVKEPKKKHEKDILLRLLLARLDNISTKEHEYKHAEIAKQKHEHVRKQKKQILDLLLVMLEHSYKNRRKAHPIVWQKVIVEIPEAKHVEDKKSKDEEPFKCKFDEKNFVTCIKDRKVYETININPEDHSEIHKIEENVRYSMVKDDKPPQEEAKESMEKIFKTKQPYMGYEDGYEPHLYHHQPKRPHYNMDRDEYMMEQEHFHHQRPDYYGTSSRFNVDDGGKLNGTGPKVEASRNVTVPTTIAPTH